MLIVCRTSTSAIVLTCAVLLAPASGLAAGIAASKPSDRVLLTVSSSPAPCSLATINGFALDTRLSADGTSVPFTVPPKKVLILDRVTWRGSTDVETFVVFVSTPSGPGQLWFVVPPAPNPGGILGTSTELPHLVVKSGSQVCAAVISGDLAGVDVAGFLTSDK